MLDQLSVYLTALFATLLVFVAIWPISVARRDASLVDFWWGGGFFAQALLVWWLSGAEAARSLLIVALIGLWSLRLSWVLIARRLRERAEDPRYTILRTAWDPGFWWKSLFVVFTLQAVIQWGIALGALVTIANPGGALGLAAAFGVGLALFGIGLETRADWELDRFKRTAAHGALCTTGLRARVRHPNYLGEIIFWTGVGLVIAEAHLLAGLAPPLLIGFFLVYVSGAPLLDEHLGATRDGYAAYRARIPGFLPRIRRVSPVGDRPGQ